MNQQSDGMGRVWESGRIMSVVVTTSDDYMVISKRQFDTLSTCGYSGSKIKVCVWGAMSILKFGTCPLLSRIIRLVIFLVHIRMTISNTNILISTPPNKACKL